MLEIKEVMTEELAREEVKKYLTGIVMLPKKRKETEAAAETVVEAIQYGIVVIKDDGTIEQKLLCPIKDSTGQSVVLDKIAYKQRVSAADKNDAMRKAGGEFEQKLQAIASVHSGVAIAMLNKLERQDKSICDTIALFFA